MGKSAHHPSSEARPCVASRVRAARLLALRSTPIVPATWAAPRSARTTADEPVPEPLTRHYRAAWGSAPAGGYKYLRYEIIQLFS